MYWLGDLYSVFMSLLGQVFATFFYSFLNTQNICSSMFWDVSRNFILQLFRFLRATFYCNFYQILRQMLKCNWKKILQNYFNLVLFSLIAWKRAIWRTSCVSMLSMTKQLVCKLDVLQPQPVQQCLNPIKGGNAENLGFWPSSRKRK